MLTSHTIKLLLLFLVLFSLQYSLSPNNVVDDDDDDDGNDDDDDDDDDNSDDNNNDNDGNDDDWSLFRTHNTYKA